jgi:hypothetical protein
MNPPDIVNARTGQRMRFVPPPTIRMFWASSAGALPAGNTVEAADDADDWYIASADPIA